MLVYGRNVAKEILKNPKKVQKVILQEGFDDKNLNSAIKSANKKLTVWQMDFIKVYYYTLTITSM